MTQGVYRVCPRCKGTGRIWLRGLVTGEQAILDHMREHDGRYLYYSPSCKKWLSSTPGDADPRPFFDVEELRRMEAKGLLRPKYPPNREALVIT